MNLRLGILCASIVCAGCASSPNSRDSQAAPKRSEPALVLTTAKPGKPYKKRWTVRLDNPFPRGVAVAPWGDVLALTSDALTLHDSETGDVLCTQELRGVDVVEGAVDFQSDGTLLLVSDKGVHRVVFPPGEWEQLVALDEEPSAALVRGSTVALQRGDQVRVYELPRTDPIDTFELPGKVKGLALSADGKRLAAGHPAGGIVIRDLEAKTTCEPFGGAQKVEGVAFHPNGKHMLAETAAFRLEVWDLATKTRATPLAYEASSWTNEIRFLSDGRCLTRGAGGLRVYPSGFRFNDASKPTPGEQLYDDADTFDVGADERVVAAQDAETLYCATTGAKGPARPFSFKELDGAPDDAELLARERRRNPPPPEPLDPQERARRLANLLKAYRAQVPPPSGPSALPFTLRSFLDPNSPNPAKYAYYLRLEGARIGGEFDAAGDEEVEFFVEIDGKRLRLARDDLDLKSMSLSTFASLDDAFWVEVPRPRPSLSVGLAAYELDVTTNELITSRKKPLRLKRADFGKAPRQRTVPMDTISVREVGFLGLSSAEIKIPDPTFTLSLVRSRRNPVADRVYLRALNAAFKRVLAAPASLTPQDCAALAPWLRDAAVEAANSLGHSTHPLVRERLPGVARLAMRVAHLADRASFCDAGVLNALVAKLETATARPVARSKDADLIASREALLGMTLDGEPTTEDLDALIEAALTLKAQNQLSAKPSPSLVKRVDALIAAAAKARESTPEARAKLKKYWKKLRKRVRTGT